MDGDPPEGGSSSGKSCWPSWLLCVGTSTCSQQRGGRLFPLHVGSEIAAAGHPIIILR
jgi:hypothetical protein